MKVYTAWTPGTPAQTRFLTLIERLLGDGLVSKLVLERRGNRCLVTLHTNRESVEDVQQWLEESSLLCSRRLRDVLGGQDQAGEVFDRWITFSLRASNVADLAELGAMPEEAIVSREMALAHNALRRAHDFVLLLMRSTAPATMLDLVAAAHGAATEAVMHLVAARSDPPHTPVETLLKRMALDAARQWKRVLLEAAQMMPETDDPDWQDKWDRFIREQLRRPPVAVRREGE